MIRGKKPKRGEDMEHLVRNEVKGMKRYIAGKPVEEVKRELGLTDIVKMASNENPLGASPRVREALLDAYGDVSLYPDSGNFELKKALSEMLHRQPEEIIVGGGSDSLIKVISCTLLKKGEEIIMGEHSFSRYEDNALLMGATVVKSPMKDLRLDLADMKARITDKTKLVYLCNPNNPTGSSFGREELEEFLQGLPEGVFVVLDEAYLEYVTRRDAFHALDYLDTHRNLIILRTFSKAYGMASFRIGYGIVDKELAGYLNRVVDPFDVNLYAQRAAVEALKDQAFIQRVHEENRRGKEYFYAELSAMGLPYVESDANFVLIDVKTEDFEVFQELMKAGFIVRPGTYLNLPGHIRVTISTMENNRRFMALLRQVLNRG